MNDELKSSIDAREEIFVLMRHAGLNLKDENAEQLVDAYQHVLKMLSRLYRYDLSDQEPAHIFVSTAFNSIRSK